ncbi:MAG TPA: AAA family ATPase [Pyrinomonadaceae bacterium]|nr:AAA family ATPase [Pyrinomonadaceae bacterium]
MKLIFLHGPPGVGKLTVGRELAALTGFRLFHNHLAVDLVSAVFDFGTEPFVLLRERVWLSVFREAARRGVSLVFTFSPERTVRAGFITEAAGAVESAGGEVLFVGLTCAEGELERRIEEPGRGEFGKLRSAAVYRRLKEAGAFEYPRLPDSGLTLDTTDRPPAETARLIAEHFRLA